MNNNINSGVGLIAQMRSEQVFKHGYNLAHDQQYFGREIFQSAAVAIIHLNRKEWPENSIPIKYYDAIAAKPIQERLAIAGAFLGAAVDFIQMKISLQNVRDGIRNTWAGNVQNEIFCLSELAALPNDEYLKVLQPTSA